ncbi:hypothetical protein CF392_12600 [Tamilnaduibacter salinus]|uniref:Tetratricopeptide repeat protein n=1 Tax=Tamilnaduibacter salinus TaxID=1484056 RepID=A0A2A2I212_9GAMM|nr:hypothetical protein [Tamilnaduibacter salinus]PAV25130.1 hypothetical protein CF392_12600 [Tamilnaduibacter salinus]
MTMFSVKPTSTGRPFRGRFVLRLSGLVGLVLLSTATQAQPAIDTQIRDDAVLTTLPNQLRLDVPVGPEALARHVQTLLQRARTTGDPRYLGYAEQALKSRPETDWTPRLHVLKATLDQSLHRFDAATKRLDRVVETSSTSDPIAAQAWLTLATVETTQGHYTAARAACDGLSSHRGGLMSRTCHARIEALTGNAESAYQSLGELLKQGDMVGTGTGRQWARAIRAEIATQIGHPRTDEHWRMLLNESPDDLTSRTAYADWLLRQGRPSEVLVLTDGYESVESLAVLRAVAFERLPGRSDPALVERLRQGLKEAQWRGSGQHHRTLARFLLEVEQQPQEALTHARKNWDNQREPIDTAILIDAAETVGATETIDDVQQWLRQHQQTDVRFSEARS